MKKAILLLFVTASIISCKKSETTNAPETAVKVGSVLTYKIKMFTATGTVGLTYDYIQTVTREKIIAGNTWLEMVATIPGLGTDTGYIRKALNGYQIYENNASQLYLKMPAAVNDVWTVTNSSSNYHNYTIKGLNQTVTVPKGSFACYLAETRDQNQYLNKVWYNDTYIVVKLDAYNEPTPGTLAIQSSLELVSYVP